MYIIYIHICIYAYIHIYVCISHTPTYTIDMCLHAYTMHGDALHIKCSHILSVHHMCIYIYNLHSRIVELIFACFPACVRNLVRFESPCHSLGVL